MRGRGFTIAETLVATVVFAVLLTATLTIYLVSVKVVSNQEAYLFFERVCLEIDKYSDKYNRKWNEEYFGNEDVNQYYDKEFARVEKDGDVYYCLSFAYRDTDEDGKEELIVTVSESESGRTVIDALNFGGARYAADTP